jgi:hypothetical protein
VLKIIPERDLETDKELCACFIDSDRANWTKLMQILKETGNTEYRGDKKYQDAVCHRFY